MNTNRSSRSNSFDSLNSISSDCSFAEEEGGLTPSASSKKESEVFGKHNMSVLSDLIPQGSAENSPHIEPSRKWSFSLPSILFPKTSPKTISETRSVRVTTSLRSWTLGWGAQARRVEGDLLEAMAAHPKMTRAAASIRSINPPSMQQEQETIAQKVNEIFVSLAEESAASEEPAPSAEELAITRKILDKAVEDSVDSIKEAQKNGSATIRL